MTHQTDTINGRYERWDYKAWRWACLCVEHRVGLTEAINQPTAHISCASHLSGEESHFARVLLTFSSQRVVEVYTPSHSLKFHNHSFPGFLIQLKQSFLTGSLNESGSKLLLFHARAHPQPLSIDHWLCLSLTALFVPVCPYLPARTLAWALGTIGLLSLWWRALIYRCVCCPFSGQGGG